MKNLIFEKLKEKVDSGKLEFGFKRQIQEFTLESYKENDKNIIICNCIYKEDDNVFRKYVELSIDLEMELRKQKLEKIINRFNGK